MQTRYILLFILLIAAGLRAYHLDYDLPEIYEEATPMRQAWEMWNWDGTPTQNSTWHPHGSHTFARGRSNDPNAR